jgi:hypothetical protein
VARGALSENVDQYSVAVAGVELVSQTNQPGTEEVQPDDVEPAI